MYYQGLRLIDQTMVPDSKIETDWSYRLEWFHKLPTCAGELDSIIQEGRRSGERARRKGGCLSCCLHLGNQVTKADVLCPSRPPQTPCYTFLLVEIAIEQPLMTLKVYLKTSMVVSHSTNISHLNMGVERDIFPYPRKPNYG